MDSIRAIEEMPMGHGSVSAQYKLRASIDHLTVGFASFRVTSNPIKSPDERVFLKA
jgi:hypothetical protein